VEKIFKEHRRRLHGHSISGKLQRKKEDGKWKKEKVVRVYVDKKVPVNQLTKKDLVPDEIDGIPTDVYPVGVMKALTDPRQNFRPIIAGCSAMSNSSGACTLGYFGKDRIDEEIVAIANNHCTAEENTRPIGYPQVQPSILDTGIHPRDEYGTLKRYVEIKYETFACNYRNSAFKVYKALAGIDLIWNKVDLGIVKINEDIDTLLEVLDIGVPQGKQKGILHQYAQKTGRTTGFTDNAQLIDNDYFGPVGYSRGNANFGPCALYEGLNFSAAGDSSSAILSRATKKFQDLLFAGSNTHTMGNHLEFLEDLGQLDLYPW